MKKLLLPLFMGLAAVSAPVAHAADVSDPFTVTLTLVPTCVIDAGLSDFAISYPSFSGSAVSATPQNLSVRCTSGLSYSLKLNTPVGAAGVGFGVQAAGSNTALLHSVAATGGYTASGTGVAVDHEITVTAASGQAGTAGAADIINHTIYVVY